mgnify:CR=1 FL=1
MQQAYNHVHDFDMPLNVASDRRKRKAETPDPPPRGGFFWSSPLMTDELRASLVSVVRKEAEHAEEAPAGRRSALGVGCRPRLWGGGGGAVAHPAAKEVEPTSPGSVRLAL